LVSGRESELLLVPNAIVAVTTATTPLLMVLVFVPLATQVADPLLAAQFSVSPAAVSADPATMLREVTSVGGYERVHCTPDGALPLAAVKERFNEIDPPLTTDPEASVRDET
jgi:hypothetical protein